MTTLFTRLASTALLLVSVPIHAITISFNPVTQAVTAGSSFEVALEISGLITGAAPSLGTFDLNVGFDPAILGFSSALFGDPVLGDQLDVLGLGGNPIAVIPGSGTVNIFELSLDTADDLNSLQTDSFTLATLTFNALSAGTSSLGISVNALGDANGDPLTTDLLIDGSVTVNGGSVPEPAICLLFGLGALSMSRFIRQSSKIGV